MARLLLASRGVPGLAELLVPGGRAAALVTTASEALDEPEIAREVEDELRAAGLDVERVAIDDPAIRRADVVAVSGGEPFHLLAAARQARFGEAVRAALAGGAVYVGYSAGAIVAGPTLEPLRLTSPFTPPEGLDLTGLGLTDAVVLPHHDRPGRAERNAAAVAAYGDRLRLVPLRDGELLDETV